MKESIKEILKVLDSYPGTAFQDNFFDGNKLYLIGERENSLAQLEQLMCYREVVAFSSAHDGDLWYFDLTCYLEQQGYSEEIIIKTIEQYKSEQK